MLCSWTNFMCLELVSFSCLIMSSQVIQNTNTIMMSWCTYGNDFHVFHKIQQLCTVREYFGVFKNGVLWCIKRHHQINTLSLCCKHYDIPLSSICVLVLPLITVLWGTSSLFSHYRWHVGILEYWWDTGWLVVALMGWMPEKRVWSAQTGDWCTPCVPQLYRPPLLYFLFPDSFSVVHSKSIIISQSINLPCWWTLYR